MPFVTIAAQLWFDVGKDSNEAHDMRGVFSLVRPAELHGKHVLVVDDVITTGATITACSRAACEAGDVRVSVFCLADAMGRAKG